ncbi:hypothetical protein BDW42DRAFT_47287 [Aspergillus taichungensis]|uniref:Uncharacterized protein n=1 Tax=Aspergillus taichungensis TaxID=482145 RepID=A0A2J5HDQ7_9EURO|nr:hypothetical protein BDW42DRAFT_47287 [Aspergillus taichungensis]
MSCQQSFVSDFSPFLDTSLLQGLLSLDTAGSTSNQSILLRQRLIFVELVPRTSKSVRLRWSISIARNDSGGDRTSHGRLTTICLEYSILSESLASISEKDPEFPRLRFINSRSAEIYSVDISHRSSQMRDPKEDAWTTDLQTVCSIPPNPWFSARRSAWASLDW